MECLRAGRCKTLTICLPLSGEATASSFVLSIQNYRWIPHWGWWSASQPRVGNVDGKAWAILLVKIKRINRKSEVLAIQDLLPKRYSRKAWEMCCPVIVLVCKHVNRIALVRERNTRRSFKSSLLSWNIFGIGTQRRQLRGQLPMYCYYRPFAFAGDVAIQWKDESLSSEWWLQYKLDWLLSFGNTHVTSFKRWACVLLENSRVFQLLQTCANPHLANAVLHWIIRPVYVDMRFLSVLSYFENSSLFWKYWLGR